MRYLNIFVVLIMLGSLLAACGSPATEVAEPAATEPLPASTTEEQATPEPTTPPKPAVGGAWVYASDAEPDTLDVQKTVSGDTEFVMKLVGGAVLALDPVTGEFVPYLAESYTLSDDGLEWEIKFKEGIKWHDGTPLTAYDYAWTMERVLANPSPATGAITDGMASAEAVDDLTVLIHMDRPNSGMLFGLTSAYMQPLPKDYIEKVGEDEYGRHPIGAGPFMFKEWKTGDRVILERNPDFNWGPPYAHEGPAYLETVEFRIIPEYVTRLAAIEAGEIDATAIRNKDLDRVKALGTYDIIPFEFQGAGPYLLFNTSKPPFDDILVRKAFNLAINRDELIQTCTQGFGDPLWGVITPATYGHWDGDKEIGYGYDPEAAKALLAEAGYTLNDDGVLEKDGQTLEMEFFVSPSERGDTIKMAQVMQQQFKNLGVILDLQEMEYGVWQDAVTSCDYTLSIDSWGWAEAQIIMPIFYSSMIGGMNTSCLNDPEFDPILLDVYMAPDREFLQQKLDEAQRYAIEKAYTAPLISIVLHFALSQNVKGVMVRPTTEEVELFDAYAITTQ